MHYDSGNKELLELLIDRIAFDGCVRPAMLMECFALLARAHVGRLRAPREDAEFEGRIPVFADNPFELLDVVHKIISYKWQAVLLQGNIIRLQQQALAIDGLMGIICCCSSPVRSRI